MSEQEIINITTGVELMDRMMDFLTTSIEIAEEIEYLNDEERAELVKAYKSARLNTATAEYLLLKFFFTDEGNGEARLKLAVHNNE